MVMFMYVMFIYLCLFLFIYAQSRCKPQVASAGSRNVAAGWYYLVLLFCENVTTTGYHK